jgi:hypothetical protein
VRPIRSRKQAATQLADDKQAAATARAKADAGKSEGGANATSSAAALAILKIGYRRGSGAVEKAL